MRVSSLDKGASYTYRHEVELLLTEEDLLLTFLALLCGLNRVPFDVTTRRINETMLSPEAFGVAESEWDAKCVRSAFNLTRDSSSLGTEKQFHL